MQTFDTPITTNDQSINRVLGTGLPIAFIFLDDQEGAGIEEVSKKLARENAGKVLVVKVRKADSPEAARRYQIQRTPAVVTIRDGKVLTKAEAISRTELESHVAYLLGNGPKPATSTSSYAQAPRPASGTTFDGKPQTVTEASFDQEVMHSQQPVLVDFWAPWCGPCRMTDPILEKMAHELAGRLVVAKVNVDENPYISQRFGVQSIPTMMIVKNGQIVDRWVGAYPESAIRGKVAAHL
jgi:thioredoxin 1